MKRRTITIGLSALICAGVQAEIITVDDDGPADFSTIQEAIDVSLNGDTILVAPGTYLGAESADQVVDLGGKAITLFAFNGPESTIIDGGNRMRGIQCISGEGPDTMIEGFTVTNCRNAAGAGGYLASSSPTIYNCIFIDNSGEGLAILGGSPNLTDCTFEGNRNLLGGGLCADGADPSIDGCQFIDNLGLINGGGAYFTGCGGSIRNSAFTNNQAGPSVVEGSGNGGGAYLTNSSTSISDCTFNDNRASTEVGALYFSGSEEALIQIESCTFQANSAPSLPVARINGNCEIRTCMISGNIATADQTYSGLRINGDTCVISDCVVENNEGGGFAAVVSPITSLVISDCTFESNIGGHLATYGDDINISGCRFADLINDGDGVDLGAIWHYPIAGNSTTITNCQFESNDHAIRIQNQDSSFIQISDCRFTGHALPVFATYVAEEIQYQNSIFCENSGGLGGAVDLGNNCISGSCEDEDGDGLPDACNDQEDIQAQIEAAAEGDVIVVPAGKHYISRPLNTLGKAITLRGEIDGEGNPLSIIDAGNAMQILQCNNGETSNTAFEDLVLTRGIGIYGGGITIACGSPVFQNCVISQCQATYGGGVYVSSGACESTGSQPSFTNCTFLNNTADVQGGAMYVTSPETMVTINDCRIDSNTAEDAGGGTYVANGTVTLELSLLCTNTPDDIITSPANGTWIDIGGNCIGDCSDSDEDGVPNCNDDCPDDPNQSSDIDTDGDGTADCADGCPLDADKIEPGLCGCGMPDTDIDGDGLICDDPCPTWPGECSEDGLILFVATGQSIQLAVDEVQSEGRIVLRAGTHSISSPINLPEIPFTLSGELDESGVRLTLLDGEGLSGVLAAGLGIERNTEIRDLVIANGSASFGGGIQINQGSPTIRNCHFLNNHATVDGGAINTEGDLANPLIDQCEFSGNSAEFGAGIHVKHGSMELTGCRFENNIAGGSGGGFRGFQGAASILNCIFAGNQATYGGGVDLWEHVTTIDDSEFLENETTSDGGGGGIGTFRADLTIRNTLFHRNQGGIGGAIRFIGDDLVSTSFENCTFTENTAVTDGGACYSQGDAYEPAWTDCRFEDNEARDGGAIHCIGGEGVLQQRPSMTSCIFLRNKVSAIQTSISFTDCDGGAIYLNRAGATILDCTFTQNTAEVSKQFTDQYGLCDADGGAVQVFYSGTPDHPVTIRNSVFEENIAQGTILNSVPPDTDTRIDSTGGGLSCHNGVMIVEDSSFTGNISRTPLEVAVSAETIAWAMGGAMILRNSDATILRTAFTDNETSSGLTDTGGAVFIIAYGNNPSNTLLESCDLQDNLSTTGGAIHAYNTSVQTGLNATIENCRLNDNQASDWGGGISIEFGAPTALPPEFEIISSALEYNTAGQFGGAIHAHPDVNPSLMDSRVCSNSPTQISTQWIDLGGNCITEFCDSDQDGVDDCEDQCPGEPDTDSDEDGTADCNDGCPLDPAKTEPGGCGCGQPDDDTDSDGDGVYDCIDQCPGTADVDTDGDGIADCIDPCIQWPGDCSEDGSVLFVREGQSISLAVESAEEDGTVIVDPGLYILTSPLDPDGKSITVEGSIDPSGQAITMLDGGSSTRILQFQNGEDEHTIFRDLVFQNGFGNDGGAIRMDGADPRIERCRFVDNIATNSGGAVFILQGDPMFVDCLFTDNQATNGGAVANEFSAFPTFSNCEFTTNRAETGGAILNSFGSSPNLDSCLIESNEATGPFGGGGLWSSEATGSSPVVSATSICGNLPDQVVGGYVDQGGNIIEEICGGPPCPTDLDGDGLTGGEDLGLFLGSWGVCSDCPADINGNGIVDGEDLGLLFGNWGTCN